MFRFDRAGYPHCEQGEIRGGAKSGMAKRRGALVLRKEFGIGRPFVRFSFLDAF